MGESQPGLVYVCNADEVEPDSVIAVAVGDFPLLAVYNLGGEYFVTDDLCTHGQASLADGFVEGDEIECPLHAGRFCIRTGEPTLDPCTEPLKTYPVVRQGDGVFIRVAP